VRELGQSPDQAQAVMLSDAWDTSGRFGTWVYRVKFTGPTQSHQWGLYIPRIGNRALITLNGHFLEQLGAFEGDQSDHAPQPHFFSIPAENLNATRNVLELTVQGEKARHAGVSIMAVGPESAVRTFFFWRHLLQTQGSFAIVVMSLLFALTSGALAWGLRERVFTLFALASLFCAVRTSYAVVSDTPFDYRIWNWMFDTSFAGYVICLGLFSLEVLHIRPRWVKVATALLGALTFVLVPAQAFAHMLWARQAWTTAMVAYALSLCASAPC
jgi:hypothetical protein